jgi:broad specificity phosphatase PhoE
MCQTIYLIRHATPDWERKDLVYHQIPGPPLTGMGLDEAKALGTYFMQAGVNLLLTSPLERSFRTAQIVGKMTNATVQIEPALIEWQPGEEEIHVQNRLSGVLETIIQKVDGDFVPGLVSHGGPIGVILSMLGMDATVLAKWRKFDHHNPLPPAGVWRIHREKSSQKWQFDMVFTPN